jgi:two-component sensor histidine kinase
MNRRILIVDDNKEIHKDFRKILCPPIPDSRLDAADQALFGRPIDEAAAIPYELTSAYQGNEAIDLVRDSVKKATPFAAAFVDVRMPPGYDGIETVERLWAIDPGLQLVISTAYSDYSWDEIAQRLKFAERFLILKKPFDNIEVLQLTNAMTRKWQVDQESEAALRRARDAAESASHATTLETLDRKKAEEKLAHYVELLDRTGEVAKVGGWELDLPTMKFIWSREVFRIHDLDPSGQPKFDQAMGYYPSEAKLDMLDAMQAGIENGTPWDLELPLITAKGRHLWVRSRGAAVREGSKVVRLFGTIHDITEHKRAERRHSVLTSELDHRVKNTLASVLSLSHSSLRESQSLADFRDRFTARIMALSRTHSALAQSRWDGLDMAALARLVLEPFNPHSERALLDGPQFLLPAPSATPLCMVLHELAINAVKHGALSTPRGRLHLHWSITPDEGLELTWRESGGPLVIPSEKAGGGTDLIYGLVEFSLGGKVLITFEPTGLVVVIKLPPKPGSELVQPARVPANGSV